MDRGSWQVTAHGVAKSGVLTEHTGRGREMQAVTFRMVQQQGPTLQHRELNPVSWDKP